MDNRLFRSFVKKRESDCIICVASPFLRIFRFGMPVYKLSCPHKNKFVKTQQIEIDKFWTNIQLIIILPYIPSLYFGVVSTFDKEGSELLEKLLRTIMLVGPLEVITFIFTKKYSLYEIQELQEFFNWMFDFNLDKVFTKRYQHNVKSLTKLKTTSFFAFCCFQYIICVLFAINEKQYSEKFMYLMDFIMPCCAATIFNYFFCILNLVELDIAIVNRKMIKVLKKRKMNDLYSIVEPLKKLLAIKRSLILRIKIVISNRSLQLCLLFFFGVVQFCTAGYSLVKDINIIFNVRVLFRLYLILILILSTTGFCIKCDQLSNSEDELESYAFRYKVIQLTIQEINQFEVFLKHIPYLKPHFKIFNIMSLGKKLLVVVYSTVLTYVLVAVQFKAPWID